MDLLRAAGASDEEKDLQNFATARHGENLCHPGSDPFEVLRRLDDPDKGKTARRDGAVGVASDDVTNVRHLVSDTDTGRPQHNCTIGAEVLTTVRTLSETSGGESSSGRQISLAEELVGETSSSADNERHASL